MKVFIIGPVRNVILEEEQAIRSYVFQLEARGFIVHWSIRDVNQNDPIGLKICRDNFKGMRESDEVHVWWNPNSQGSVFDLGMAFAQNKKVVFINKSSFKETPEKSFTNVLFRLDEGAVAELPTDLEKELDEVMQLLNVPCPSCGEEKFDGVECSACRYDVRLL